MSRDIVSISLKSMGHFSRYLLLCSREESQIQILNDMRVNKWWQMTLHLSYCINVIFTWSYLTTQMISIRLRSIEDWSFMHWFLFSKIKKVKDCYFKKVNSFVKGKKLLVFFHIMIWFSRLDKKVKIHVSLNIPGFLVKSFSFQGTATPFHFNICTELWSFLCKWS